MTPPDCSFSFKLIEVAMFSLISQIRNFIYLQSRDANYSLSRSSYILNSTELANVLSKLEKYYHSPTEIETAGIALIDKNVTLQNISDNLIMDIVLSLPEDSKPSEGKISVLSPLGGLVLGSKSGDLLTLDMGNSSSQFKVISISDRED
jgi:transcription elongation GreA/GreB family factor